MVVSGAVALVCAGKDVAAYVDGFSFSLGSGDIDYKDVRTIVFFGADIFVGKDIVTSFLAVVDDVPKLLFHFPHIFFCESGGYECAVPLLVGSDEDEAAVGVGECGIGLPQAVRKPAFGFLGFETVVFPVCIRDGCLPGMYQVM